MVHIPGPLGKSNKSDHARPWSVRTTIAFVAGALPIVAVLSAAAVSTPAGGGFFGDFIGAAFMVVYSFVWGIVGGFGAAWTAFSVAFAGLAASTIGGALLFGILAGLAVALMQRRWLPVPTPVKKSVAATIASKEFWIGTGIDSVRLIATNLAVAYGVVALMSVLTVFAVPDDFRLTVREIVPLGERYGAERAWNEPVTLVREEALRLLMS